MHDLRLSTELCVCAHKPWTPGTSLIRTTGRFLDVSSAGARWTGGCAVVATGIPSRTGSVRVDTASLPKGPELVGTIHWVAPPSPVRSAVTRLFQLTGTDLCCWSVRLPDGARVGGWRSRRCGCDTCGGRCAVTGGAVATGPQGPLSPRERVVPHGASRCTPPSPAGPVAPRPFLSRLNPGHRAWAAVRPRADDGTADVRLAVPWPRTLAWPRDLMLGDAAQHREGVVVVELVP